MQSVKVNTTTQNIEVAYMGPPFGFEFSSPTGSLQQGSLSNIDHIVVVMMENRSFDHMLGYLSLPLEKGGMGRSDVDGLKGNEVNQLLDGTLCPSFAAQPGDTVFAPDPPHSFEPVGRAIDGGKMDGFAQSTAEESGPNAAANIMKYHTAVNVPTFDALARDFALCHRWFASHPGPTFPNRYHATTGRANIDQYGFWEVSNSAIKQPCFTETIFDYLSDAQVSWTYYEQSYTFLRFFEKYTFDNTHIVDFDDPGRGFLNAAATGNLPSVTFIDPHFIELPPGSDCDGPPADARQGQLFVQQVVEALVTSPNWEKTMLIITYDEHGGFYDHVSPPPAVQIAPGLPATYGVRVPTFVVSPWVTGGSVFGNEADGATPAAYYDHTSILRTITKRFLSADVPLGPRYAAANDLSSLIHPQPRSSVLLPFIPYNFLFSLSQNRLAVQGASSAPGAPLCQLTPDDTSPAQLFSFEDAGGGQFYIRTQNGSLYLTADIAAAGTGSAVPLKQDVKYSASSGGNPSSQLWAFVWQPSVIGSGVKLATIHNVAVPGKSLHPAAQSIVSGALVVLETVTSSTIDDPNYLWEIGSPLIPGTDPPITIVNLAPTASPASLTFGLQQVGTKSAQQTVTISGNPAFALTALAIVDSNGVADPNFVSVPPPGSPPPAGSVNIQNGRLVVTVWFFPTVAGALNARLQISHNQAGSPLMIPLSGTGNPQPLPLLKFSPGSLIFDPTKITNHTVTLQNTGTAPLTIISIVIADSNYTMSNTCNIGAGGGTLQPGQQCQVSVVCRFTGPGGNSQMVITHDAAGTSAVVELNATSKSGGGGQ